MDLNKTTDEFRCHQFELLDRLVKAHGILPSQRLSSVEQEVAAVLERGIEPFVKWTSTELLITMAGVELSALPR